MLNRHPAASTETRPHGSGDRLLAVLTAAHEARFKAPLPQEALRAAAYILSKNIVQGHALTLLDAKGRSIVFSEWSPVNGTQDSEPRASGDDGKRVAR